MAEPIHVTAGVTNLVNIFDNFLALGNDSDEFKRPPRNKYELYDRVARFDNEISSGLTRLSGVVEKSFEGPTLLEGGNTSLLNDVKDVLGEMGFVDMLGEHVTSIIRDGDVINVPVTTYKTPKVALKKLDGLEPVPMRVITISDTAGLPKKQTVAVDGSFEHIIRKPKTVLFNETAAKFADSYAYDEVFHTSLGRRGNWANDIMKRPTFGIYGESPLASLTPMINWKYQSIRDDAAWRRANVPRVDHSVPLGAVLDINQYTGTIQERVNQARELGAEILADYQASLTVDESDNRFGSADPTSMMDVTQGYIHDGETKVAQVGGHNTYADCLPIVKKVDQSIAAKLGVPMSALGYEEGSTYAIGKITVLFMNTFGLYLLRSIQRDTFDFVKRVLAARGKKYTPVEWSKLYLDYNVSDFEELLQTVDAWTKAYEKGLCTLGEGRDGIGLAPNDALDLDKLSDTSQNNTFNLQPGTPKDKVKELSDKVTKGGEATVQSNG